MQVFKFGGASIKDAERVKKMAAILKETDSKNTLVVVSAMGKTTNALESVVANYFENNQDFQTDLQKLIKYHNQILFSLFESHTEQPVFKQIKTLFGALETFLKSNKSSDFNFVYDQVVAYGELLSSTIISAYLSSVEIQNEWIDARTCIKTDAHYRAANVNWENTQKAVLSQLKPSVLNITQGFLGSDSHNLTTTLGREGSDYTAAIFAFCLQANRVILWKEEPGILNADPRYFDKPKLLNEISFSEAIELAFYGAKVIHPNTLQPLQEKEIPLYVKSFLNPKAQGTSLAKNNTLNPTIPCFMLKKKQVFISVSSVRFLHNFNHHIHEILTLLNHYNLRIGMVQNSAISISFCVDDMYHNLQRVLCDLKLKFKVLYYEKVSLYTIRHYNDTDIAQMEAGKTVLMKQVTPKTFQIVTQETI